jgi:hypothetical protein
MRDELVNNNLMTEAIALTTQFQQNQPELYAQEYAYFERFLIEYYLYTGELEQVKASLVRFAANPGQEIDEMLQVLDLLKFYNATEIATDLCRATYHLVENSPDVIGGTEAELGNIIAIDSLEKAYQKIKIGASVNWEELKAQAREYGYAPDDGWLATIEPDLSQELQVDQQFFQAFKKQQSRQRIYGRLSLAFYKYMADEKQVSFICSQGIWETIFKFLINHRQLKAKQLAHPDRLFGFSQRELERFLAHQIGSFFCLGQAACFATLWGIPYLYQFLAGKQIISPEIHQQAIASATELKKQLMAGISPLWKFDFIHRWLPDDSVSQADWQSEAQQFAASSEQVKPLSDEPGQDTFASLDREIEQFFEEQEQSEQLPSESLGQLPESVGSQAPIPTPSVKPPKPKKSPLQEAAELLAHEKKTPQNPKKRGFD